MTLVFLVIPLQTDYDDTTGKSGATVDSYERSKAI